MTLALLAAALVLTSCEALRMHIILYRLKTDDARRVAEALGSYTVVDGIELPKHDDPRWKIKMFSDRQTRLHIGEIIVDDGRCIYVGNDAPYMYRTAATKSYCASVWKAYRSRVARKAQESTT